VFLSERMLDDKAVSIRLMQSDDLDTVAALEQELQKSPWSRQAFANELDKSFSEAFVVICDDKMIAYATTWLLIDEMHINTLAVIPECRRMGIATWFLNAVLDRARATGICTALLEVRKCNRPAVRLYQQLGFTIVGERKAYYSDPIDDALLMTLHLK